MMNRYSYTGVYQMMAAALDKCDADNGYYEDRFYLKKDVDELLQRFRDIIAANHHKIYEHEHYEHCGCFLRELEEALANEKQVD
jgi:hypothetical protein